MTDRPIIMSTESVKAILDGKKTMSRRVIKPQPKLSISDEMYKANMAKFNFKCPYGQVGQRLWVRETWAIKDCGKSVKVDEETWADGYPLERLQYIATDEPPIPDYWWNKRPSIFMPRWASRITLEITKVRVERLQDISREDALAEGIDTDSIAPPEMQFCLLWNSINAKRGYGWEVNPWVFVISFKRKQKDE